VDRLYSAEAMVNLKGEQRKAMANQLTTVSTTRLRNVIGRLGSEDIAAVDRAIRVQLAL
jgi:mRNA-degrading endonuclease toxin of MazEF toxin-antitoxin module